MKKFLFSIVLCVLMASGNLSAQTKMVVSEYFNVSGSTTGEWIELLVIEDNVNIVGFYVRDNSGTGDWMGGLVFNDVPLWRNLRKGTTILINTRGNFAHDVDPKDGYIKIDALNTNYFTKRLEPGTIDNAGTDPVLNINALTDCIQLLDNNNNHHHALSQSTDPVLTAVAILPAPKVVHVSASQASAVRFWGFGGGAYNQTNGTDSTSNSYGNDTPGFANQGGTAAQLNINQRFWRAIRQPQWTNPAFNAPQFSDKGITLSWNAAQDAVPADSCQGYIVLRHLASEDGSAGVPEDSYVYPVGSSLGSSIVLANISRSTITSFLDSAFKCNEKYIYRVYAYRYTNTGDDTDNSPLKGRGRSYNETSSIRIEVNTPSINPAVLSVITGAKTVYCNDDIIKIVAKVPSGIYNYEWQINGTVHSQDKNDTLTITVRKGKNTYRLLLTNELGCSEYSNEIVIEGVDKPNSYIARILNTKETKYTQDETVTLCLGDILKLNGTGGPVNPNIVINWYKDGVLWLTNQNIVDITSSGIYYFIVSNQGSCPDTSYRITAVFNDYNFTLSETLLSFPVDLADTYLEKTVILSNKSSSPLELTKDMLIVPSASGYSIVSPATFPVTIPGNGNLTITVRFTPIDFGVFKGRLLVISPCKTSYVQLEGFRDAGKATLSAGSPNIDLGKFLVCENKSADSLISITALGNEKILIATGENSNADFTVDFSSMPVDIMPYQSFNVNVELTNRTVGIHSTLITIPYRGITQSTLFDTLKLFITAEVVEPKLNFDTQTLDLGVLTGCESSKDTLLNVTNNSGFEIRIDKPSTDPRILINNLPIVIQDGETAVIDLSYVSVNQDDDFTFDIVSEPCSESYEIRVIASFHGAIFTLDQSDFNFGTVYDCSGNQEISKDFTLNITNIIRNSEVEDIIFSSNDYEIDGLSIGQSLANTNNFTIKILNPKYQNYSGNVEIFFKPCGNSIVIPISGSYTQFDYSISDFANRKVDFGTVTPLSTTQKTISISNNSNDALVIAVPPVLSADFVLISPLAGSFPVSISKETPLDFTFAYLPLLTGTKDSLRAEITIIEPCVMAIPFDLIGKTTQQSLTVNARLELPANRVTAELGKPADFTLSLFSKSVHTLKESQMAKLSFNLNYNPTLLFPVKIDALASMIGNTNTISINELQAGKLNVVIEPKDMTNFIDGEFAKIQFTALLGNSLSTKVSISDVAVTSPHNVLIETTVADFEIVGGCLLDQRLIQIGEMPGIIITNSENNGLANINVTHIVDSKLDVSLYDILGNKVETLCSETKTAGNYNFSLNKHKHSAGVYYILIQFDGGSESKSLIINK